jgi:16S rRNA (guanine527-N7)-methyltransferase
VEQLSVFRRWLEEEAIAAGGIGPGEGERVLDRHVSDSLVFAGAWPGTQPDTLIDVGSGVGLPGIPLAVAMPATRLTLLDRSARRCSLARRAIRILGLENVEVVHSDVGAVRRTFGVVTFRASLAPAEALRVGKRLIDPGGTVVVAASRVQRPTEWHGDLVDIVTVPAGVLDSPAWLLRMRDNPSED